MKAARLANAVCPGIVHAQVRYKELLRQLLQPGVRWLDLGCGHEVVRSWALLPGEDELTFTHAPALSVGVDRDGLSLRNNRCIPNRVAGDIQMLPFTDCSFDVVTANMVLEHAERPAAFLSEVWRVLRPKGVFVFHTPNKYFPASLIGSLLPDALKTRLLAAITSRNERDVYSTFYRINTRSAITRYCEATGFRTHYFAPLETLTVSRHRVVFLFHLAVARLLRWKALAQLQANFLVMLCKPGGDCPCPKLAASRADDNVQPWPSAA